MIHFELQFITILLLTIQILYEISTFKKVDFILLPFCQESNLYYEPIIGGQVKDSPNWGDGWGWALFLVDDKSKNVATDYKKGCIGCHIPVKDTDWIHLHGYPVLR